MSYTLAKAGYEYRGFKLGQRIKLKEDGMEYTIIGFDTRKYIEYFIAIDKNCYRFPIKESLYNPTILEGKEDNCFCWIDREDIEIIKEEQMLHILQPHGYKHTNENYYLGQIVTYKRDNKQYKIIGFTYDGSIAINYHFHNKPIKKSSFVSAILEEHENDKFYLVATSELEILEPPQKTTQTTSIHPQQALQDEIDRLTALNKSLENKLSMVIDLLKITQNLIQ